MPVCCVVCELKETTLSTSVLQELLDIDVSLIAVMEDQEVKLKCQGLCETDMICLKNAAKRTLDAHGEQKARLLRNRFNQKRIVTMEGLEFYPLEIGSILQVLDFSDSPSTPEWNLIQLLKSSVIPVPNQSMYPDLTGVRLFNSLSISIRTGAMTLYYPNDVTAIYDMELGNLSLEEKMESLHRKLLPMECVSMIVLDDAECCGDGEMADAQQWINFLKAIYGDLNDMWVIMVFSGLTRSFQRAFPNPDPDEVYPLLNRNTDKNTLAKTKFADVIGDEIRVSSLDLQHVRSEYK